MDPIKASAWIVDGRNRVWLLIGPDTTGLMGAYSEAPKLNRWRDTGGPKPPALRALGIEDRHGIVARGPRVTLDRA